MKRGFTLLEMMLSVALLALISVIILPVYQSFQLRNDLDLTQSNVVESLRRSQILSQSSAGDTRSGVRIEPLQIIIFRGLDYVSRDPSYDEIYDISPTIIPSGINEINFSQLKGIPSVTGSIILTSSINEIKTITINEKGVLIF